MTYIYRQVNDLIHCQIIKYNAALLEHITFQAFDIPKPASLPFYLLVWGQVNVKRNNCIVQRIERRMPIGDCGTIAGFHDGTAAALSRHLITHIYYTESDQIVNFQNRGIVDALVGSLNDTILFMGARKEKVSSSDPANYDEDLQSTRPGGCGQGGFVLDWPKSRHVMRQNASDSSPILRVQRKSKKTPVQQRLTDRTANRLRSGVIENIQEKNNIERLSKAIHVTGVKRS